MSLTLEQREILRRLNEQEAKGGYCVNCQHNSRSLQDAHLHCKHLDRQVATQNLCLDFTKRSR